MTRDKITGQKRTAQHRAPKAVVALYLAVVLGVLGFLSVFIPAVAVSGDLADEPILYSNHPVVYKVFTPERLFPLYNEFSKSLNSKLRFHVSPFLRMDEVKKEWYLAGEVLEVYYQENTASLDEIQQHAESIIAAILKEFKELTKDDSIRVYVRLPEGKKISDINPEMPDPCRSRNTIMQTVNLEIYEPGKPDELFYFLCDGARDLDANLVEKDWPLTAERWRTTPEQK